jgi:flavin-binding protein dodecin
VSTETPGEDVTNLSSWDGDKGGPMVEKTIELTGASSTSIEDAVSLAIARAAVTISGIYHVQLTDISAQVEDGMVARWKVKIKATFPVKDRVHE